MLDGILNERLEDHRGERNVEGAGIDVLLETDLVGTESRLLEAQIIIYELELLAQRNEILLAVQQPPEEMGQLYEDPAGLLERRRVKFSEMGVVDE